MNLKNAIGLDIEVLVNYVLLKFLKFSTDESINFELNPGEAFRYSNSIQNILNKYLIITFNGNYYDKIIMEAVLYGFDTATIFKISDMLINSPLQPWTIRKQFGFKEIKFNHIDLINVAPSQASLKIYGGRLHSPKMQDLHYDWKAPIKEKQKPNIITYCGNDLDLTKRLCLKLKDDLDIRIELGNKYRLDLRSKSDAQVAEEIIKSELRDKYGVSVNKPKIKTGICYRYSPPNYLNFESGKLKNVLNMFTSAKIKLGLNGHVKLDQKHLNKHGLKNGKLQFGHSTYKLGIGGIHSTEKSVTHISDEHYVLKDFDVKSFYPRIILNNRYFPKHLGEVFLEIYGDLVDTRLEAKAKGLSIAKGLKIAVNGTFGKLANKYSVIYAPDLMMQVTVTGQLSLLMLIEKIETSGFDAHVVSANTDGIVVKMHRNVEWEIDDIISDWEAITGYEMECNEYISTHSRDVNNYIAIQKDGKIKSKGAYADSSLEINPSNEICSIALKEFLKNKTPIEKTIKRCNDITKFVTVKKVSGGAVKFYGDDLPVIQDKEKEAIIRDFGFIENTSGNCDEWVLRCKSGGHTSLMTLNVAFEYAWKKTKHLRKGCLILGKAIRWYYGANELDAIYYQTNGNKVPKSDGGVPLMELPKKLPNDIDYNWYIYESNKMLKEIGFSK